MKRKLLVAGLLVMALIVGGMAVSAVQIGSRSFTGPLLSVGVRLGGYMLLDGRVYLPFDGFVYVFYRGGPHAGQYLISPNKANPSGYRATGFNDIDLSMLDSIDRVQKLTVVLSPYPLVRIDFSKASGEWLSVNEIEENGLWLGYGSQSVWVAELTIPSTTVGVSPCWWTTIRYTSCQPRPVLNYCYQARPCVYRPLCCPASPCLLWLWLMGVALIH